MASTKLATLQETGKFGQTLAQALLVARLPALLLDGPLGCGKTTLTAAICASLPGAQESEISSPSFTICNLYPCSPPVLHCDFYRCENDIPEEVWEFLDQKKGLLIAEWPGYLRGELKEYLDISFDMVNDSRWLKIRAYGEKGNAALATLSAVWPLI